MVSCGNSIKLIPATVTCVIHVLGRDDGALLLSFVVTHSAFFPLPAIARISVRTLQKCGCAARECPPNQNVPKNSAAEGVSLGRSHKNFIQRAQNTKIKPTVATRDNIQPHHANRDPKNCSCSTTPPRNLTTKQ